MVLEKLITTRDAVEHPVWMIVIGAIVALISLGLSSLIFPESIGLFTTILITFTMTPFMVNLMTYEEIMTEVEMKKKIQSDFFNRHENTLFVYATLFGGMIIALSLAFLVLPENTVTKVFNEQIQEIQLIRGDFLSGSTFFKILFNNIGVLFVTLLFSFIFGSGAIFILSWNASVLSAAIGLTAKSLGGFSGIPGAIVTYLPHGVFEISAYFLSGIAGGILSAAVIRKKSEYTNEVAKDSLKVMLLALGFLFVGAIIESILIGS
ncbi:MAG: stage II sporulation protein M [Candidatus Aenigmarchaeota archaeon]|nr:stage II sporulation protein M [Candidatus Aenigmarchaeota archaeon]